MPGMGGEMTAEYTITVDRIEGDWVVLEVAQVDGHEITLVDVPAGAVPDAREGARYRLVQVPSEAGDE